MARTDLLFDHHNINAVAPDGALNVATSPDVFLSSDEDKEPDIRLTPSEASLQLGGGSRAGSNGRAELLSDDGAVRISLSSTDTAPANSKENVFSLQVLQQEGDRPGSSRLRMGRVGKVRSTVELDADRGRLSLGGGTTSGRITLWREEENIHQLSIFLSGRTAEVRVGGAQADAPGARKGKESDEVGEAGSVKLYDATSTETVTIKGAVASDGGGAISLSDSEGGTLVTVESEDGGAVVLRNPDLHERVSIESGTSDTDAGKIELLAGKGAGRDSVLIQANTEDATGGIISLSAVRSGGVSIQADGGQNGGKIDLKNGSGMQTVTADGGTGTLMLGRFREGTMTRGPRAENGEVWLDDGRGEKYGLKAENGVLGIGPSSDSSGQIGLVLKPEEGVFGIVDDNGNFVFRIDTEEESIEVPSQYNGRGAFDIERRIRKNGQG